MSFGCGCVGSSSCCAGDGTVIYACSGQSNLGQITNEVALRLKEASVGSMACLVGVGAGVEGMVLGARDAKKNALIDGCPVKCGLKAFEKAGIKPHIYCNVSELGLEKSSERPEDDDVNKVFLYVKEMIGGLK